MEGESSGLIGAECNFRQSSELGCPVEIGIKSKTIPDCSEVCLISDRSSLSLPCSFSFMEERSVCAVNDVGAKSNCSVLLRNVEVGRKEQVGEGVCEPILEGVSSGGGKVVSLGGVGGSRVLRRGVVELGERSAGSKGLELVPYTGLEVGKVWSSDGQYEDEFFKHLGWVQELVDDSLFVGNGLSSPLEFRESGIDGEKLVSGMSQVEVSKWVLKRINGFSKFLGVSFDGFEDQAMHLFSEIEEKWRKGVGTEAKKSGNKSSRGVRELKRLQCSVNYEGRKKAEDRESEVGEGVHLLSFYEDQNSQLEC